MAEPEDVEEDLFADLYDADDNQSAPAGAAPVQPIESNQDNLLGGPSQGAEEDTTQIDYGGDGGAYQPMDHSGSHHGNTSDVQGFNGANGNGHPAPQEQHGTGIKEDGKMFIGGLNWETTDQSLKDYFSQFGEVAECTVMRDGATGRSRGFGFLTFKDAKTVNTVMVKEHYLDGKIIDPKRAIPRDEQEKTSKIFVGGVSQEATEQDFKQFFMQFGRVIDATLMIDKDTGRPRGFGFVTFDSEAAVDATLEGPLEILGKPIEVKKAQPRGNMREEDDRRGGRRNNRDNFNNQNDNQNGQNAGGAAGMNGMTPQMMAQYWQRMQQYFAMMQQNMAMAMQAQQPGMGGMGGMNPAMMQQMQQMQQMQMKQMQGGQSPGGGPPNMQGMNPAMMQQMQQQMMQQQQQAQQQGGRPGGFNGGNGPQPNNGSMSPAGGAPGFNAQDQIAFEQQKYEQQQQARRFGPGQPYPGAGGPTSWEGMYDDVPQPPNMGGGPGGNRGGSAGMGRQMSNGPRPGSAQNKAGTPQPSAAPANAPTGPKNAGKPGANYRGGGRGGHRGFHPYQR